VSIDDGDKKGWQTYGDDFLGGEPSSPKSFADFRDRRPGKLECGFWVHRAARSRIAGHDAAIAAEACNGDRNEDYEDE
jgi:hypothetical protein